VRNTPFPIIPQHWRLPATGGCLLRVGYGSIWPTSPPLTISWEQVLAWVLFISPK
jgi:hypothetical protein